MFRHPLQTNWNASPSAGCNTGSMRSRMIDKFDSDQEEREDPGLLEDTPKDCLFDSYAEGRYLSDEEAAPRRQAS